MQSFGQAIPVLGPLCGFPGNWSRTDDTIIVSRPVLSTAPSGILAFGAGAVLIPSTTAGSWESAADYLATPTNAATLQQYWAGVAIRNVQLLQQSYSSLAQGGTIGPSVATTATQATVGAITIVVASATGIQAGQSVEGVGIQANTTVVSVSGTTVTISLGILTALSSTNVWFTSSTNPPIGYFSAGQQGEVLVRSSVSVAITNGTPQAGNPVYIRTVANSSIPGTSIGDFEAATDLVASPPTVTTTAGGISVTVSANTGLAVGQQITGPMFGQNTVITAISGDTLTISQGALYTASAQATANFSNTLLLGSPVDPWLKFRTGQIDANNIAEIMIPSRHAA